MSDEKRPASVLIAEDDEDIRNILEARLTAEGYEIHMVADGKAAIEYLSNEDADVVVLDMWMPHASGFDVLKAMRDIAPESEVVVITADGSLATQVDALRMGVFDVVRKPFAAADLLSTVSRAVERRRLRAATALYRASHVIFSGEDPQRLPERIVDVAMKAMDADAVSLMLPDGEGRLHIAHANRLPDAVKKNTVVKLGEPIAGKVAAEGKPVILSGPVPDGKVASVPASSIVYPLFSGERLVGLLNLNRGSDRKAFRNADLERAGVLASQVVLALENVRLFQRAMLAERMATVGRVAAGIAHEINNPAAYVATNVAHVRDRIGELAAVPPDVRKELTDALDDASEGIERIAQIVSDMRGISRGEEKEEEFDINDVVRAAIRVTTSELSTRATLEVSLGGSAMMKGTPGRLTQVFVNLLTNAGEALKDLPKERRVIRISTRVEGTRATVEVSDQGSGIAPTALVRLFEPFFTTRPQGLGLGLSISRQIVQKQGGEISVESEVGKGTTFRVVLPAHAAATSSPQRLRLLFIDDEPAMGRAYRRAFGKEFDVTIAGGGEEAMKILAGGSEFNVVVSDLWMPDLNGMQLYAKIVAQRPALAGKFLFATGSLGRPEVQEFATAVGGDRVIAKTTPMSRLRELILSRA